MHKSLIYITFDDFCTTLKLDAGIEMERLSESGSVSFGDTATATLVRAFTLTDILDVSWPALAFDRPGLDANTWVLVG